MPVSTHPGMGALPFDGGVTFRVWVPHATAVHVAGTFDDWNASADPLAAEADGYWSTDVATAKIGDHYKFALTVPTQADVLWKNDPYARSMTQSNGDSLIVGAPSRGPTRPLRHRPGTSS